MEKAKDKIRWIAVLAVGLALVAASLVMIIFNLYSDNQARKASEEAVQGLGNPIVVYEAADTDIDDDDISDSADNIGIFEEVPVTIIDGRKYIGTLYIKSLDLILPVQKDLTDEGLSRSPCRYAGSVEDDDLIICGHNMASQFRSIRNLQAGDEVVLELVDGSRISYKVTGKETIDGGDVEAMESGDWSLTLFTCTMSRISRIAIRCSLDIGDGDS